MDVGTGDGRFPYERARRDPASFYIGIDPDATTLAEYAYRASRKPARGGLTNVLYVVAAVEQLPPELHGIADVVHVNFPWGGLLRGLLRPDEAVLRALHGLAAPAARVELVLCYDPEQDSAAAAGDPLTPPDKRYIDDVLSPAYAASGIVVTDRQRLGRDEALAIPSTWGRRLLHGRPRDAWLIVGQAA